MGLYYKGETKIVSDGTDSAGNEKTKTQYKIYNCSVSSTPMDKVQLMTYFSKEEFNFLESDIKPIIEDIKTNLDDACSVTGAFDVDGLDNLDEAKQKLDQLIDELNTAIDSLLSTLNSDWDAVQSELDAPAGKLYGATVSIDSESWEDSHDGAITVS